jgi:hypothetical protein
MSQSKYSIREKNSTGPNKERPIIIQAVAQVAKETRATQSVAYLFA